MEAITSASKFCMHIFDVCVTFKNKFLKEMYALKYTAI